MTERAAEILECSPETVVERIEAGDIAAEKFGRSWIIVESAFWDNLHRRLLQLADERRKVYREKLRKKDWRQSNKGLVNFHAAKRRAARMNRTPPWVDMDAVKSFYSEARRISQETGVQHDVDHIIPMQGELVSGLHVHTNLQIITAAENNAKKNRYEADR